jgi:hypothetical protein
MNMVMSQEQSSGVSVKKVGTSLVRTAQEARAGRLLSGSAFARAWLWAGLFVFVGMMGSPQLVFS